MTATEVKERLKVLASPEVAVTSATFFKTGPGQYGAGDIFIGVRVPAIRKLAGDFRDLPLVEVEALLHSPIHEERLLALLILVAVAAQADEEHQQTVYNFYLSHTKFINNWDLVDTSAPSLVGAYLTNKSRNPLLILAKSIEMWERRIAIIATQHFIRRGEFEDTLKISQMLLSDKEDLIHKATGWMLREVGKRHEPTLIAFLEQHGMVMPRTMLRYAIERLPPIQRQEFLLRK